MFRLVSLLNSQQKCKKKLTNVNQSVSSPSVRLCSFSSESVMYSRLVCTFDCFAAAFFTIAFFPVAFFEELSFLCPTTFCFFDCGLSFSLSLPSSTRLHL